MTEFELRRQLKSHRHKTAEAIVAFGWICTIAGCGVAVLGNFEVVSFKIACLSELSGVIALFVSAMIADSIDPVTD